MKTFKLDDQSIVAIANLVQMGIITGTDIVDQLRTLELCEDTSGLLTPTQNFSNELSENINKLVEMAESMRNDNSCDN